MPPQKKKAPAPVVKQVPVKKPNIVKEDSESESESEAESGSGSEDEDESEEDSEPESD